MSKVMRNSMTRLHSEVMRTINYYRSNQSGAAPKRILLTGGGAQMGYVAEFFSEKLKLPVELFDSLRGVQIERGANEEAARAASASLGELSGLALRGLGGCPLELELIPDAIFTSRDAARRAPVLIMAGVCLFATLGASIFWCQKAQAAIEERHLKLRSEGEGLISIGRNIQALEAEQEQLRTRASQLQQIVQERSWWVRMFDDLNKNFSNDLIWLTIVEPLKDNKPLTQPLWGGQESEGASAERPAANAIPKYELSIQGLYRKNNDGDQQVVTDYAAKLSKLPWFDAADFETNKDSYIIKLDTGAGDESRFAHQFEFKFPLKNPPQFK
jgi:Tfp pilus assembly protein PilN